MTSSESPRKTFTVRMANLMLPLVQSIVADIVKLSDEVEQTRQRLDYLNDGRVAERSNDIYGRELKSIEKHTNLKSDRIHSFIRELSELNLNTDRVISGFVDFPAVRKEESVCLCWQLGEREVLFWHRCDEDCSQRRPVDLELIRQSGQLSLSESV